MIFMNNIRKECKPQLTIEKIKKILKQNNIKVKEYKFKNINKELYSIRIEIKGFYNLGTNGKGISKDLAKASAYAELMERLQSRLLIPIYYLTKENSFINTDEIVEPKIIQKNQNIINTFFENNVNKNIFFNNNSKYNLISKYYDLKNNKYVYLPIKLINATTYSNGLCAGNSYFEAVNQGICEIFERYCYQTIVNNEIILNTIIIDNKLDSYYKIENIKKYNLNVYIKDFSLGIYPVVGVIITNKDNSKYIMTVGSDLNIDIAIQRCLTEIFQGLKNINALINKMKDINNNYDKLTIDERKVNWLNNYSTNNGIHPTIIFNSNVLINYNEVKAFKNLDNNKDVYKELINIITKNNLCIYIKDYSFLKFHTYKVFIPKLSNIITIDNKEASTIKEFEFLKSIYFNLDTVNNKDELKRACLIIEDMIKSFRYSSIKLGIFFHSYNFIKTNYNNITFELLYVLIKYKINEKPDLNTLSNKKLINYLNSINCQDKFSFIIKDLKLIIPKCPNCKLCRLKTNCKYKNWKKLNNTLKEKEKLFLNK